MPLNIIHGDITKIKVDAIVNAANSSLLGGGGVDGCIHRAAGPRLLEECRKLGGCETGNAKITKGYKLSCKYVIHAVGPEWMGGNCGEEDLLFSCYEKSLELASVHKCKSVAFPLIAAGIYGYPKDDALRVAMEAIGEFLTEHVEMQVYIVLFNVPYGGTDPEVLMDVKRFILKVRIKKDMTFTFAPVYTVGSRQSLSQRIAKALGKKALLSSKEALSDLARSVGQRGSSFSEKLFKIIEEKGLNEVECYKKAGLSRKTFSKIRKDDHYTPSKETALAFVITLGLDVDEAEDLLKSAGVAFSDADDRDLIVLYFIEKGVTDLAEVNYVLADLEQPLING